MTAQTYDRWKREYGGLRADHAKRLKNLKRVNTRLNRFLAEAGIDKTILRETASDYRRRAQ